MTGGDKFTHHTITVYQTVVKGSFYDGTPIMETQALTLKGCLLYPSDDEELESDEPFFRLCVPLKYECLTLDGATIETKHESLFRLYSLLGQIELYDDDVSLEYKQYIAECLRYEGV